MLFFLVHFDRLRLFVADAHSHAAIRRRDAQVPIPEPADQVKGLPRRLLPREP
jgi:hypothetical protein